jgi:demethylmenaquinone methyltransferase / 2-methoxy-6-polyprenyl-1,4-benzoquinol methylase
LSSPTVFSRTCPLHAAKRYSLPATKQPAAAKIRTAIRPALCYDVPRMTNMFYQPGQQRAARVVELFDAIAHRYDLINDLQSFGMHRRWKRRFVQLAGVRPGERALDLCCGTGDVALALARQGARVIGLDFSGPMLAVAHARSSGRSPAAGAATHPNFLRGNALGAPFQDNSFDVVTIAYGLRNLASVEQGLSEMWRVARPGGRLLVLDFGKPDNPLWRSLYFGYLKCCVPLFGRTFCRNAQTYAYILESLNHYPAQHGVTAALGKLNCRGMRVVPLLGGAMSIHYGEKV